MAAAPFLVAVAVLEAFLGGILEVFLVDIELC